MHATKRKWVAASTVLILAAGGCDNKLQTPTQPEPAANLIDLTGTSADVPAAAAASPEYIEVAQGAQLEVAGAAAAVGSGIVRVYQDEMPWFGLNRAHATLLALGKVPGVDYFIHPLVALQSGIPAGTRLVILTSNSTGSIAQAATQNHPAAQSALAAYLNAGGVAIIDMGDNLGVGGFIAPGSTGTPALIFPNPPNDATLVAPAGHGLVIGPDGLAGTSDDLDNTNIDACCFVAHGNLQDGITLPAGATALLTAGFSGPQKVITAEYCYRGGRVILDTNTKEFFGQQPVGSGPPFFMRNLFAYALSPAALCNTPPTADAGGAYNWSEGSPISLALSGSDADGDALTFSWDLGDGTTGSGAVPPATHTYADNGTYTITLNVDDGRGGTASASAIASVSNVAPDAGTIDATPALVALNGSVSAGVPFKDPGTLDTHSAQIDWGDGTTEAGAVSESSGSGSATGSHQYTVPGVYRVRMTITDKDRDVDDAVFEFVVVYDPSAGFVTGGGWINSPAGAYLADPSAMGKATFGFVSKYQKGKTLPSGETQFQFHAVGLDFHSSSYEWLVVAGARAQFKGDGVVNGVPGYKFLLTAIDGAVNGGGGLDRFRIKIVDGDGNVIYDNVPGASDQIDEANPQTLGGGSIVIHS